jgi:GxxExxY protein
VSPRSGIRALSVVFLNIETNTKGGDIDKLLHESEVFQIRGAVFDVHNEMGAGFLEAVYQECLAQEFEARSIPFIALKPLTLTYKGRSLNQVYRPDFVCFDKIIVELKATSAISQEHRAQTLNYLKGTGLRLGLLINFGVSTKAYIERIVL